MKGKKVKLNILGVSYSQTKAGAYALILTEENGNRKIPIVIGGVEAQSITIKLENLEPPRPLTHDLFYNLADAFAVKMSEVNIYNIKEGVFYSEVVFSNNNKTVRIDARTSDAVALATRFNCPIYTYEEILEKTGIILEQMNSQKHKKTDTKEKNKFSSIDTDTLKNLLRDAISRENYEKASEIRDEINKRDNEI